MNKILISEQINTQYREYALYVIQSRGIPNFYDCITPVQRLVLENSPSSMSKTVGLIGAVFSTGLYHHGDCLDYETEINLYDGTKIKIGEWAEKNPDKIMIVSAYDELTGLEVKGIAHSPRVGHLTDEYIEIEMENGEIFKCTKNHPFLTKRGWVHAENLTESDEIIEVKNQQQNSNEDKIN
jgi:DNA gyrase/topoisomerase IV subunit A